MKIRQKFSKLTTADNLIQGDVFKFCDDPSNRIFNLAVRSRSSPLAKSGSLSFVRMDCWQSYQFIGNPNVEIFQAEVIIR